MHVAVQEVTLVGSDLFFICSPVPDKKFKTLSILVVCSITFKLTSPQKNLQTLRFDSEFFNVFLTNVYGLIYTIIWSFITNKYHFFILISQQRHCQKLCVFIFCYCFNLKYNAFPNEKFYTSISFFPITPQQMAISIPLESFLESILIASGFC